MRKHWTRFMFISRTKMGGVGKPEFRLPAMLPGTLLLPIGCLITGWSAQAHTHWIVPDIGIALVGAGIVLNFQCIQIYIIDCFTLHAASALAAICFLRSLAGFGFPLFAPAMYSALGFGKGDTCSCSRSYPDRVSCTLGILALWGANPE
ncbi:hypothetical protein EDB19DRAFT_309662 [Suillus lakei]|nr:hypothetical protein EDB19DRAFT_309662 [Suillus lakei]